MEAHTVRAFFEIHRDLPREGPGSAASTGRALAMLSELPPRPRILDIGCGPGMQTLDLAALTAGPILAVDNHQPYLDRLNAEATRRGVSHRISAVNADMAALDYPPGSFDLIWAEGSAYLMGFENALRAWRPLLRKPGYLAATEITWTTAEAPAELRRFWAREYPSMQDIESNRAAVGRAGYSMLGHFQLPASDWWQDYYTPLEQRLARLRGTWSNDPEALAVVALDQQEIDIYRRYSDHYGYVFYVMRTA